MFFFAYKLLHLRKQLVHFKLYTLTSLPNSVKLYVWVKKLTLDDTHTHAHSHLDTSGQRLCSVSIWQGVVRETE